jgi:hypothetical protein
MSLLKDEDLTVCVVCGCVFDYKVASYSEVIKVWLTTCPACKREYELPKPKEEIN